MDDRWPDRLISVHPAGLESGIRYQVSGIRYQDDWSHHHSTGYHLRFPKIYVYVYILSFMSQAPATPDPLDPEMVYNGNQRTKVFKMLN